MVWCVRQGFTLGVLVSRSEGRIHCPVWGRQSSPCVQLFSVYCCCTTSCACWPDCVLNAKVVGQYLWIYVRFWYRSVIRTNINSTCAAEFCVPFISTLIQSAGAHPVRVLHLFLYMVQHVAFRVNLAMKLNCEQSRFSTSTWWQTQIHFIGSHLTQDTNVFLCVNLLNTCVAKCKCM